MVQALEHPLTLKLVAFSCGELSDGPVQILTEFSSNGTVSEALRSERTANGVVLDATAKSKVIFGTVSGMAYYEGAGYRSLSLV
jgi:hypothetical protein